MSKRSALWLLRAVVFSTFAWALANCGSDNSKNTTTTTSPTFSSIYSNVIGASCVQCHQPGGSATLQNVGLDFTSQANAYAGLTGGTVSARDEGACAGVPYIAAGAPTQSYLLAVIDQTYYTSNFNGVNGCTPQSSHLQDTTLSADQQSAIVSWIQQGAQNN